MSEEQELINSEDELTVTLELEDGTSIVCAILTILEVDDQEYIALLPLEESGEANKKGEIWFYRFNEDESDPDGEPILGFIDDDEEYERVADAFDEFLDEEEFEEAE